MSERYEQAIEAVEKLLTEYVDVFAPELDLPVVADWALVVAHDSAIDPSRGKLYRLNKRGQWRHRSIGLLQAASDDYRDLIRDEG